MFTARLWLISGCLLICGCTGAISPSCLARSQVPAGGSPAEIWTDTQARFELEAPGRRISCRAIIRRLDDGSIRLALITDEGPLLADLTVNQHGVQENSCIDSLHKVLSVLGRLAYQAWGTPAEQRAWENDRIRATTKEGYERWYGGDPLLLRQVDGQGSTVVIGDYRVWHGSLLAYCAETSGLGYSFRYRLSDPRSKE